MDQNASFALAKSFASSFFDILHLIWIEFNDVISTIVIFSEIRNPSIGAKVGTLIGTPAAKK